MHKNSFHRFLNEQKFEKFDCGEFRFASSFSLIFPILRKAKMSLPVDMYKTNLLVLGCNQSYRRRFTQDYARRLIEKGVRVLYITDALSEHQYRAELEIESFNKHIGLNSMDEKLVHKEVLSGTFNQDVFDNGALLSIVHFDDEKRMNHDARDDYNSKLMSLLKDINESEIATYEYQSQNPKTVVFIDDELDHRNFDTTAYKEALDTLKYNGVNFVICGLSFGFRYEEMANDFGHYVFFRVKDPLTELRNFGVFKRQNYCYGAEWNPNYRDLSTLERKQFYYTQGHYAGWTSRITYDGGGCDCCTTPPDDFYGYVKPE